MLRLTRAQGAHYDTKIAAGKTHNEAMPETAAGRSPLAPHDHRRTPCEDEPGRTFGGDCNIQRGWLNPDHQLFG